MLNGQIDFVILSDFFEEKIVSKDYKIDYFKFKGFVILSVRQPPDVSKDEHSKLRRDNFNYFNFNEFVILSDFHLRARENFIEG